MNIISYDKYFEERGNQFTIYNDKDLEIDFVQDKVSKSHQGVAGYHGHTELENRCAFVAILPVWRDFDLLPAAV